MVWEDNQTDFFLFSSYYFQLKVSHIIFGDNDFVPVIDSIYNYPKVFKFIILIELEITEMIRIVAIFNV